MTEMPSYMIENPKFEPYKPKKRRYYTSSMLTIFLSIFTYIMIFYVFEVSPSSVFKDTKVLFFISNTLILIIAADYGAFSDKESHDFYSEYKAATATMRSRADYYSPIPVSRQRENLRDAKIKNPKEEEEGVPMVKEIVYVYPPEKIVTVVNEEKPRDVLAIENFKQVTDQTVASEEACDARNHVNPNKPYGRSRSDKPRRKRLSEGTETTKRKSYGRRKSDCSTRMVIPEKWENVKEESEEFSKLSNEELNKRVEEFIQRFNRQIRSQSSRVSST
ncbi:unnamed protein product [Arabidopsis lyrata]|uniref:Cotton fiber protein n=1 Tax=Arabidopsis lyrata subsp. lyrata TaxID=81972 RepID=D7KER8_ARALL|nr:uncharacterized protein LOC9298399 [Arabidopsis lyrata subsp. lyrata]XP_002890857.1 uncharacterized protein LOC9326919 [Arabidopsis lyrata subsp. lyrata]CAH8253946.1 unnamed protein product [Arabidopsis lyrata]EFH38580.1 hypothetical protein ARALYDRAFT_920900 [Arabidopsis lyrata subsp. lyrata]EFH67116.1 hypothetical protein ARALYDRAFT_890558 [Arabidopsis lyrata subsp. lyrata]CAH8253947.1 unnamed protein product [Arabidopsis lyrata]|eukprot:XP_002862322.1 uncharacterized protein LOC9298399 [Arabidopsis lyrata subsp. lyrata]